MNLSPHDSHYHSPELGLRSEKPLSYGEQVNLTRLLSGNSLTPALGCTGLDVLSTCPALTATMQQLWCCTIGPSTADV